MVSAKKLRGLSAKDLFDDLEEVEVVSKYKNPALYTGWVLGLGFRMASLHVCLA